VDLHGVLSPEELKTFHSLLIAPELEALQQLKNYDPEFNSINERFLIRFVLAKKLQVEEAAKVLKAHLEFRKTYSIDETIIENIRYCVENSPSFFHPEGRTEKGKGICYIFAAKMIPDLFKEMNLYMQFIWWIGCIASAYNLNNDRKGFIYIEDFKDCSFGAMIGISSTKEMKPMMDALQASIPVRLRKIYLVNTPWYLWMMMKLVSPFLSHEMQKRIELSDYQTLHATIGDGRLVEEIGGVMKFDYASWAKNALAIGLNGDPSTI